MDFGIENKYKYKYNTVDAGYKHIVGNCISGAYNRHVLITVIKYIGYIATVFQHSVLISDMFL